MAKVSFGSCLLLLAGHVRADDSACEAEPGEWSRYAEQGASALQTGVRAAKLSPDEFVAVQTPEHADVDALCELSKLLSYESPVCDKTSNRWLSLRSVNATYGDVNMMARYKATHKHINVPPNYKRPHVDSLVCLHRPTIASGQGGPPSIGFLIPKVASSSLRSNPALSENGFVEGMCFQMNKSFIMDPDVVRFAVVREPVSRFAAALNQIYFEVMALNRTLYQSVLRDNPPLDPKERFAQFLEDVLIPGKVDSYVFTTPQTKILLQIGPDDGRLQLPELDFLVSLDMLDTYMPELGELLGFKSQSKHISYPGYIAKLTSNEAWQALADNPIAARSFCDQYALDYRVFGFELPSWCSDGVASEPPRE